MESFIQRSISNFDKTYSSYDFNLKILSFHNLTSRDEIQNIFDVTDLIYPIHCLNLNSWVKQTRNTSNVEVCVVK